jgi:serine/threonine protein kinase
MTETTHIPKTAESFLMLLEKSGLLSARQIARVRQAFDVSDKVTGEQLAREMVRKRVLTPFQAERLLEGRYRGFLVDQYRIREILGVGGMGCVFIAEDPDSGNKVALKILSSQHATDAGMLARMQLEAWAGMRIDHPNVVRTHRIGSTGAVNYIVMDLMRAISLHEMVALGGPVRPALACDMFRQAALGLQAAHDMNIIHRDIKPANLLIDHEGHTSVLDFGLALVGDDSAAEFSLAMIFGHDCLGTPDYIAPEQSRDSNKIDARADVYSLGCTMYVALTGRVPFADCKTNKAKLEAQRTRSPVPVHQVNPQVPKEISDIVAKMTSRAPADRHQSAREVAAVLEPFSKQRPVKFDFRRLITIRSKLARQRELAENRSRAMSHSHITSTLSWVDQPSHHLRAEGDTFTDNETPAVRQRDHRQHDRPSGTGQPAGTTRQSGNQSQAIPRGWYVQPIGSRRRTALKSARCRVGTAPECEIHIRGRSCDEHQCRLEYDGTNWNLKQISLSHPTFVDGELTPYTKLKPGSQLTFQDGTGFVLRHLKHDAKESARGRVPKIYIAAGILAAISIIAGLATAAWWLLG